MSVSILHGDGQDFKVKFEFFKLTINPSILWSVSTENSHSNEYFVVNVRLHVRRSSVSLAEKDIHPCEQEVLFFIIAIHFYLRQ